MDAGDGEAHRKGGFPPTRHSVIERIRDSDPDARRTAFGDLVAGYWKPVYKHLRVTWRLNPEDAQDLAQGFFAEAFQKGWLERFDPAKAKFRTFVRVCADRFVMNTRQADSRLKRGGGARLVPLDFGAAEAEIDLKTAASASAGDPDVYFHREFTRALFDRAIEAVRAEYVASGRSQYFELFQRYDLSEEPAMTYAILAREYGLTPSQVTNHLAQVRRRFRELALESLRGLCGTEVEFRREARDLFGLEVD